MSNHGVKANSAWCRLGVFAFAVLVALDLALETEELVVQSGQLEPDTGPIFLQLP